MSTSGKGIFPMFCKAQTPMAERAVRYSQVVRMWGPSLIHVFDRGYASGPWVQVLGTYRARFSIRWIKKHVFLTPAGTEKKLWQIGQGKKYLAQKEIRESHTGEKMSCDLWWTPVFHPQAQHQPLFLVKARVKKSVLYLVTNEEVKTADQAWAVFFSYRRRWQIETTFRYAKCELALECPRLWSWDARLKLLGMVMLVYAFLLSLLDPVHQELVQALLRFKCHRTGKRCQDTLAPLYRVRWALSRLWDDYRPRLTWFLPPSLDPRSIGSFLNSLERFQKNWIPLANSETQRSSWTSETTSAKIEKKPWWKGKGERS